MFTGLTTYSTHTQTDLFLNMQSNFLACSKWLINNTIGSSVRTVLNQLCQKRNQPGSNVSIA
jgi:hypothetical protein